MAESTDIINYVNKQTGKQEVLVKETNEVFSAEEFYAPVKKMKYNLDTASSICKYVRDGYSFKKIVAIRDMPDIELIHKWMKIHPDFKQAIKEARQDCAEAFAHRALDIAGQELTKDEVPSAKLTVDTYKWYAEKMNPEQFGNKTTIQGDEDKPLTILIDTGIKRS